MANSFFFFFQAEDGIRDADVTGVQTCALPISDRADLWDGDQVAAAEAAALTLDPALLVGALEAGLAEERVVAVVAAQGDEPLVLDAVAALQDAGDRRLEGG